MPGAVSLQGRNPPVPGEGGSRSRRKGIQTKKHTDQPGARRPLVSPTETTFWAVLSVAGWVLLAALVWILGPDQASQTATDEDTRDIRDVAPASGPESDN